MMSASDKTVTLSNLDAVRADLGCDEDTFDLPRVIASAKIYGAGENITSAFKEVDLCDIQDDVYEISYFSEDSI